MVQSYRAEINGSHLVWLDVPPAQLTHRRVLVVVDEAPVVALAMPEEHTPRFKFADVAGRLKWRGDAAATQRALSDA